MKRNNFGYKGWIMILYCCLSYYLAAGLSTVTLNWYPAAFAEIRPDWGGADRIAGMANLMSGLGGWLGIIFAMFFSVLAARYGSRKMAIAGNTLCAAFCLVFAFTSSLFIFCAMIIFIIRTSTLMRYIFTIMKLTFIINKKNLHNGENVNMFTNTQ